MAQPRVSVGLPVYNGEKYLPNALTRLLEQTFEDFELIVCDNASTDRTQEICRSFAEKDSRVRYFRNETNIGLSANHNRTFVLSRGQYFKWTAHDDDYPPEMLKRFVATFEKAPSNVGVVYSLCEYIDESGRVVGINSDGVAKDDPSPHKRLMHVLQYVHMFNSQYGLMRSEMLRRTRLFGLYPMSDHVFLAEMAMLGIFVEIPEPLMRLRLHPGRTFTANKDRKALRELFDPGRGHKFLPVGIRTYMKLQLVRSAVLSSIPPSDKAMCTAVALVVPQWRDFRAFGGRQKKKLLHMLSPASGHP